jgi:hypothetical protein
MERFLDQKIGKKTRRKDYYEYLVKWKDLYVEDATERVLQRYRSMKKGLKTSWTRVHEHLCPMEV